MLNNDIKKLEKENSEIMDKTNKIRETYTKINEKKR